MYHSYGLFHFLCGQLHFLYGQLWIFYMLNSTFYIVNLTLIWSPIDFLYAQLMHCGRRQAALKQRRLPTTKTFNRYPPRVSLPHKHWRPLETCRLMTSENLAASTATNSTSSSSIPPTNSASIGTELSQRFPT